MVVESVPLYSSSFSDLVCSKKELAFTPILNNILFMAAYPLLMYILSGGKLYNHYYILVLLFITLIFYYVYSVSKYHCIYVLLMCTTP